MAMVNRTEVLTVDTPVKRMMRIAAVIAEYNQELRIQNTYILPVNNIVQKVRDMRCIVRDEFTKEERYWVGRREEKRRYRFRDLEELHGDLGMVLRDRIKMVERIGGFKVGVEDVYKVLCDLVREGKPVMWVWSNRENSRGKLGVQTAPIVLEDTNGEVYKLGPMIMWYNLVIQSRYGNDGVARYEGLYPEVDIEAVEPYWDSNEEYFHPHVSGERLCAGDGGTALSAALVRGDMYSVFEIVEAILGEYNPDSPYKALEEWEGGGIECASCGCEMGDDDKYYCERCNSDVCESCSFYCEVCNENYCLGCAERSDGHNYHKTWECAECGKQMCSGCAMESGFHCGECDKVWCEECAEKLEVCAECGEPMCSECGTNCADCGKGICINCVGGGCSTCGDALCASCIVKCVACGKVQCNIYRHECSECSEIVGDCCVVRCQECSTVMCPRCKVEDDAGRVLCPGCLENIDEDSNIERQVQNE